MASMLTWPSPLSTATSVLKLAESTRRRLHWATWSQNWRNFPSHPLGGPFGAGIGSEGDSAAQAILPAIRNGYVYVRLLVQVRIAMVSNGEKQRDSWAAPSIRWRRKALIRAHLDAGCDLDASPRAEYGSAHWGWAGEVNGREGGRWTDTAGDDFRWCDERRGCADCGDRELGDLPLMRGICGLRCRRRNGCCKAIGWRDLVVGLDSTDRAGPGLCGYLARLGGLQQQMTVEEVIDLIYYERLDDVQRDLSFHGRDCRASFWCQPAIRRCCLHRRLLHKTKVPAGSRPEKIIPMLDGSVGTEDDVFLSLLGLRNPVARGRRESSQMRACPGERRSGMCQSAPDLTSVIPSPIARLYGST